MLSCWLKAVTLWHEKGNPKLFIISSHCLSLHPQNSLFFFLIIIHPQNSQALFYQNWFLLERKWRGLESCMAKLSWKVSCNAWKHVGTGCIVSTPLEFNEWFPDWVWSSLVIYPNLLKWRLWIQWMVFWSVWFIPISNFL